MNNTSKIDRSLLLNPNQTQDQKKLLSPLEFQSRPRDKSFPFLLKLLSVVFLVFHLLE
jgi:hypothetical protein